MSSQIMYQLAMDLAMDFTGPPGITHPLFKENYAWVDECLREKYYSYALTSLNYDEFLYSGLIKANEPSIGIKRKRFETDISEYEVEVEQAIKRVKGETQGKYKIMLLDDALDQVLKEELEMDELLCGFSKLTLEEAY
jgi:hypothetical protein